MFAIVGLADATNHLLQCEGLNETFGKSVRGDEIATAIMDKLKKSLMRTKEFMPNVLAIVIYYTHKWVQVTTKKTNATHQLTVFV